MLPKPVFITFKGIIIMKIKKDTKEKVCIWARVLWDDRCSFKFWGADLALLLKT
jgi:hypothetical protein